MESEALRKAREFEQRRRREIPEENRPKFHLTPLCGWMNDPNGFSFYEGRYHLFYQYYPYEAKWGLMHWGHAVTRDLLRWEYLPCALAPDESYDRDGCFSGSALTLPDGRHLLVYTGVTRAEELQVQCIAIGDGRDYRKEQENPVILPEQVPMQQNPQDFRDPKIWKEEEGYGLLLSGRSPEGNAEFSTFFSRDGRKWEYRSSLLSDPEKTGCMWECPDLFSLDGWDVLLYSPMGGSPEALLGRLDRERWTFHPEKKQRLDQGEDFYAPQTMLTPDGRRILIGWMESWERTERFDPKRDYAGQMTLPRELTIKEGKLRQRLPREAEGLPQSHQEGRTEIRDFGSLERFYSDGETESRSLTG